MAELPGLPDGVHLTVLAGAEENAPIELTVRAADANELAWRIHDLIPLIQSGKLNRLIESARFASASPDSPRRQAGPPG